MNIIETKDLYFSYPDGTRALQKIDLYIQKGDFLGILGPNGSGKTTILRLLNGLLKPTQGEVCLEGRNIRYINKDIVFSKVCTMFQNPDDQLFAPTVSEDIGFGPTNMGLPEDEVERRIKFALESVGMTEFATKLIHSLSFGQKKRICLAGVLAMSPEVILLDEPTASLDPIGVSSIMHLLKELNIEKTVTIVMATHSVELVPLFINRVVILNGGKIISEGEPEKVFSKPETIRFAKLRLPQIGHLFEILKKKDGFNIDHLPLTIGEARHKLKSLFNELK